MKHVLSNSRWNFVELLVKGAASVVMLSIILFSFNAKAEEAGEKEEPWAPKMEDDVPPPRKAKAPSIKETAQPATQIEEPTAKEWLARPGTGYEIAGVILLPIGIAGTILGAALIKSYTEDPHALLKEFALSTGISSLGIGLASLGGSIGCLVYGNKLAIEYDKARDRKVSLEPFATPAARKTSPTTSSIDGAVVGLKGTF
ncbi:MAG: hypothetical protein WC889_12990 [Myxococcota bacterium]|jgi:hypothetical protein